MIGRALVMTRKLLIVFLVGSISPLSFGATAWYEADGTAGFPLGVWPGQVVTITLNADFAVGAIQIQIINDNGSAGHAMGVVQPPYGVHANLTTGQVAGAGANLNGRLFAPHLVNPLNSFQGSQGMNPAAPAYADLLWFEYTVPFLDISTLITIDSYNVNPGYPASAKEFVKGDGGSPSITDIGAVQLHIVGIPEPATLTLVALGGLWLLRRRK